MRDKMSSFTEKLIDACNKSSCGTAELESLLGLNFGEIKELFNGERVPTEEQLQLLCIRLSINSEELMQ